MFFRIKLFYFNGNLIFIVLYGWVSCGWIWSIIISGWVDGMVWSWVIVGWVVSISWLLSSSRFF